MGDVARRAPPAVPLEPLPEAPPGAVQAEAPKAPRDLAVVQQDDVEQVLEVGRGPPALNVHLAEAELALAEEAPEEVGVPHDEATHRTWPGARDTEPAAVGDCDLDRAALHALKDRQEGAERPAWRALRRRWRRACAPARCRGKGGARGARIAHGVPPGGLAGRAVRAK